MYQYVEELSTDLFSINDVGLSQNKKPCSVSLYVKSFYFGNLVSETLKLSSDTYILVLKLPFSFFLVLLMHKKFKNILSDDLF